jgi:hypothetical protein
MKKLISQKIFKKNLYLPASIKNAQEKLLGDPKHFFGTNTIGLINAEAVSNSKNFKKSKKKEKKNEIFLCQ